MTPRRDLPPRRLRAGLLAAALAGLLAANSGRAQDAAPSTIVDVTPADPAAARVGGAAPSRREAVARGVGSATRTADSALVPLAVVSAQATLADAQREHGARLERARAAAEALAQKHGARLSAPRTEWTRSRGTRDSYSVVARGERGEVRLQTVFDVALANLDAVEALVADAEALAASGVLQLGEVVFETRDARAALAEAEAEAVRAARRTAEALAAADGARLGPVLFLRAQSGGRVGDSGVRGGRPGLALLPPREIRFSASVDAGWAIQGGAVR